MSTTCTQNHTKFLSSGMVGMLILSVEDCSFDPPSNQDTKIGICCCCWSTLCDKVCQLCIAGQWFSPDTYFPPTTKST